MQKGEANCTRGGGGGRAKKGGFRNSLFPSALYPILVSSVRPTEEKGRKIEILQRTSEGEEGCVEGWAYMSARGCIVRKKRKTEPPFLPPTRICRTLSIPGHVSLFLQNRTLGGAPVYIRCGRYRKKGKVISSEWSTNWGKRKSFRSRNVFLFLFLFINYDRMGKVFFIKKSPNVFFSR